MTDAKTDVVISAAIKVPEISLFAKVENKIYGEKAFSGVNNLGITSGEFTANNYTNIQINS
ncbi:hypothetical protein [Paenibacillus pini]|uniref:Uncharacterized protein n=1 Tax=Paenibacillus pini JCM 16418 TaxID=1236976 RepID=W7YN12_9BACL|nr:hypothetical protein [Paenibacillus pini]GAF09852.1 hypothetical protein JCM16418_4009 [Paenibacillus pini JCM 16418]